MSSSLWEPAAPYLNTATYGLPPAPAWAALQAALEDWPHGRVSFERWNDAADAARGAFARLVGVHTGDVASPGPVSQLIGYVPATLPAGARVLAADVEFTSLLFPFLAHADRGGEV